MLQSFLRAKQLAFQQPPVQMPWEQLQLRQVLLLPWEHLLLVRLQVLWQVRFWERQSL